MELQMYTIRDSKAGTYSQPFYAHNKPVAERHLHRMVKDPNSMVCQFPEDYDLYELGTYDDSTGLVKTLDTPKHLHKAIDFKDR